MKSRYIFIIAIVLIGLAVYYQFRPLVSKVRIRNTTMTVSTAVTEAQKQKGLGGRESMPDSFGMLFLYDHEEQFEFWMRGMQFPLDFVWIKDKTVVDLTQHVPPPTGNDRPRIVKPKEAVDTVLELNAGSITRYGIATGDAVQFLDR